MYEVKQCNLSSELSWIFDAQYYIQPFFCKHLFQTLQKYYQKQHTIVYPILSFSSHGNHIISSHLIMSIIQKSHVWMSKWIVKNNFNIILPSSSGYHHQPGCKYSHFQDSNLIFRKWLQISLYQSDDRYSFRWDLLGTLNGLSFHQIGSNIMSSSMF